MPDPKCARCRRSFPRWPEALRFRYCSTVCADEARADLPLPRREES